MGASANPARRQLLRGHLPAVVDADYEVWFVNPRADEILGRPVYPSLADLPGRARHRRRVPPPERPPGVLDEARRRRRAGRSGCSSACGATRRPRRAEAAGLDVVMDRCLKIEHARFHGGLHLAGFDTGVIDSRRRR